MVSICYVIFVIRLKVYNAAYVLKQLNISRMLRSQKFRSPMEAMKIAVYG